MTDESSRLVRLGPGAEFDLIRRFIDQDGPMPEAVRVGPGDDAAVIEGGWVISTDMSVEDVHFRRAWLGDQEIGYRAVTCALSDLAAMAASPIGVFVSLAAGGSEEAEAVHAGCREAASAVGVPILGGDLTRTPGPLVVDVVVLGCTSWPVLRNGAEPDDEVWVTGQLGASAAAVAAWSRGDEPPPAAREAFARPVARITEACCLVDQEIVDALIDVSDGLAGDAGHLAAASGVRIVLEADQIPIAPVALEVFGPDGALAAALHGGDDYELCFVTDPGVVDPDYVKRRFGLEVTRVGRVSEGEGVWLAQTDGEVTSLPAPGFDHFAQGTQ